MNMMPNDMIEAMDANSYGSERDLSIGRLLLDAGKITPQDAERVLKLHKVENLRFGEAAIKLGLVSEIDIQHALARQFDYPYLTPGTGNFSPELVAAYHPFSAQVESLRALRTQLLLRWFHAGHAVLALVGVDGAEGCSFQAANLAVVFSQLGERTLLIDANLRAPRQHQIFNLGHRPGLSEMLAGRADASAVTRIPHFVGLSVLSAGTTPPNPVELLTRNALAALLQDFAKQYDVILIDTPPAGAYSETQTLAMSVGGALLIARQDHTRMANLAAAKAALAATGAEIVGAVLSQF